MQLALEWLESNRAVMDQEHIELGWFLRHPNGSVVNMPRQANSPNGPIGPTLNQFFIDWRNPDAAAYFVAAIVNSTLVDGVDATFTDYGPVTQFNTTQETIAFQFATQAAENYLIISLAYHGKTCFDCIGGRVGPSEEEWPFNFWGRNQFPPKNNTAQCAAWMRNYCRPEKQGDGMFLSWNTTVTNHEQILAAFLVTRGPYAVLGNYFMHDEDFDPLFALDVGTPQELCQEKSSNVFSRRWSQGTAQLDCNDYTASLPFNFLEGYEHYQKLPAYQKFQ